MTKEKPMQLESVDIAYTKKRAKQLEKAKLVEWDGSMIFSEEIRGHRDGWFDSPDSLLEYLAGEEADKKPEFAFVGRKRVRELDLRRAIFQMTEDTYDQAEVCATREDMKRLEDAVAVFNEKYAVKYYERHYKNKVRVAKTSPSE